MSQQQINPCLLEEWKRDGELLIIWGCERCHKKIPFYKQSPFVDDIMMMWADDHRYCDNCYRKINGIPVIREKVEISRISLLLEKYEFVEDGFFQ